MAVRLELNVNPSSIEHAVGYAVAAESLRFDRIGIWDSPALYREPWVVLAAVAAATKTTPLGPNVTNPLTRHPLVTASAAASIDELAPNRVYLAFGTGDSGVYNLGLKRARLGDLERYIAAVRALLEQGRTDFDGQTSILTWARRRIPVYVSAHGEASLRLAARVADGIIVGLGVSDDVVWKVQEVVASEARAARRDPQDIDVWHVPASIHVDPDPQGALGRMAWIIGAPAHHLARGSMVGKFVPARFQDGVRRVGEAYNLATHGAATPEQQRSYVEAAKRSGVFEYLVERFLVVGTEADVAARLRHLDSIGAGSISHGVAVGGMSQVAALAKARDSLWREATAIDPSATDDQASVAS